MPQGQVTNPPSGSIAFETTDEPALLTQAACLLIIGLQLRGALPNGPPISEVLPQEDLDRLKIPALAPSPGRGDSQPIKDALTRRFGNSFTTGVPEDDDRTWRDTVFSELARDHFRLPTSLTASLLLEACLRHPHELVRVAAATAYHDRSSEPERLTAILLEGTRSADLLIRQLAATGLAHAVPYHARLKQFTTSGGSSGLAAKAGHTAMLIHGTLALGFSWWRPGGDFHTYLGGALRPDLYSDNDYYRWSGAYTEGERDAAATALVGWVNQHNEQGLDLFAHSHGGSVSMLASHRGLRMGKLYLLSCPVHAPKYLPDFAQVGKTVSIRVHLDLIILGDRGGQRFRHPQIHEHILPIWFNHSATHNPDVWRNVTYGIPGML
jgi:hypothetical protein